MEQRKKKDRIISSIRLTSKNKNICLISPRIAVQKNDFLGSGIPYWPIELAITAEFLREKKNNINVIDLFGTNPSIIEEKNDHYMQGISIKNLKMQTKIDFCNFIYVAQ